MRSTIHDRLTFLLASLLVAACLLAVGIRLRVMADHSIDFGGSELNILHGIGQVVRGAPIYSDPEQAPFAVVQYTPAYHLITGRICNALGIAAEDVRGMQQLSRAFSLLLNLLTMLVVVLATRRAGGGRWAAVSAAALTGLALSPHFFARVDSLYAFFFAICVLFMLRWTSRPADRSGALELTMAGICTALAVLSKQTAVMLLVMVIAGLVAQRAWRAMFTYSIAFALGFIGASLIFLQGEDLDLVLKNTIGGLRNGISLGYLNHLIRSPQLLGLGGWLIIALAIGVRWLRAADPTRSFIAVAFLVALPLTGIALLKAGSEYNYFFEVLVLSFIVIAASFRHESARALKIILLLQCVLFSGVRIIALRDWSASFGDESRLVAEWEAELRLGQELEAGLHAGEGVVLTYRSPLEISLSDRVLVSQRDIIQWSSTPPFDLTLFHAMMREGRVRYVISDHPIESMLFVDHVYPLALERSAAGRWLYVPVAD